MRNIIKDLNMKFGFGWKTEACCCGHGRYPMTIVIGNDKYSPAFNIKKEIFSNIFIHRKKKFYKKDKDGYYYIPEVI